MLWADTISIREGQYLALRFYFHYNPGPDDMALTGAIEDVRKKSHENLRGDKDAATDLTRDVKVLSSIVDKGQVSIADQVSGRYYRGYAIYLLGWLYNVQGQPIDMDLAKQALLDFDRVIASNTEVAGLKNSKAQAGDLAGQIALDQTRSSSLAYSYWTKCAEGGHAGCIYEIASRNLIHEGERPPDFGKALELYTKVFYTGVDYQCVGGILSTRNR